MSQKSYFKFLNPTFALREPALKLKMDFVLGYLIIVILKVGRGRLLVITVPPAGTCFLLKTYTVHV